MSNSASIKNVISNYLLLDQSVEICIPNSKLSTIKSKFRAAKSVLKRTKWGGMDLLEGKHIYITPVEGKIGFYKVELREPKQAEFEVFPLEEEQEEEQDEQGEESI